MSKREIIKVVRGQRAVDGAGVHMVRVIGLEEIEAFDPFLLLDSFDSTDPADYLAGFPMHPHRGIETVTYLISGRIDHADSMGNKGSIGSGECQWMTAGCGILHEEMPQTSERMLGFQLWLNLPRAEKMADPAYCSITRAQVPRVLAGAATVGVLSGSFGGVQGVRPRHIPASVFDIELPAGASVTLPTAADETVLLFLIEGGALFDSRRVAGKSGVLFGLGDTLEAAAPAETPARIIFLSGRPLHEPIAWGAPVVMNTQEELMQAFHELREGTFIRHG